MVALCTTVLALVLLTSSCLAQDNPGADKGGAPFTAGPDGPPPPTESANRRELEAFLHARGESLEERGEGDMKTRMGKACSTSGSGDGFQGCNYYPNTPVWGNAYLWCQTGAGEDDWESCCSWSCTYYKPWWGDGYNYCYVNSDGNRWDYCKAHDWGGK